MSTMNRDKINILSKLKEASYKPKYRQQQFRFTGDASETSFTLTAGWKPIMVFSTAGALVLEGAADDYTVSVAHETYTVTFAVAPSAADFVIVGEFQQ